MIHVRRALALSLAVAAVLLLLPAPGSAAPMVMYSKQAFVDAQNAGKPIVVFVHAIWCVTCRRQEPIVNRLAADPAFAEVVVLKVDYDRDKQTLKELRVADRSTLLAFHGKSERARSSFVTDPAKIRKLFERAL